MQTARRIRSGDMRAFRALYDAHAEMVYHVACRVLGDRDLASDTLQDTFLRALDRIDQFRGPTFAPWLRAIALSVSLNHRKRHRTRQHREVRLEVQHQAIASPSGCFSDDLQVLRSEVNRLDDRDRQLVLLHDIEGFTHREIAEAFGIPAATSRTRLARARRRLRERLIHLLND